MIGCLLGLRAGQRPKSTFRQLIIETAWKSYISSPRPKPRPFLPTIENDRVEAPHRELPFGLLSWRQACSSGAHLRRAFPSLFTLRDAWGSAPAKNAQKIVAPRLRTPMTEGPWRRV